MRVGLHGVALAVLAALPSAYAQQAVEKVERIEVTGSRIASSSDVESASPIAVIKAEDIRLEGFQSIELVLNNFPQFYGDQGNRISNGATGTATVNLRALGPARTLVLVNGKRMPAGDPFVLSPDLNQVPPQLIQRVEVLTGGASAVYGSDAIAGVVNFILNDHFEGVQGEASYDFNNHQQKNSLMQDLLRSQNIAIPGDKSMDGQSGNVSLTMGGNFAQDKGNAAVSFRYFKAEALLQSERDYSGCPLSSLDGVSPNCGGSTAGYPGRYRDLGFFPPDPSIQRRPRHELTIDPVTGNLRPFSLATDLYNFAPLNYYQRPQERYSFNAFANYDIAPDAKVYTEFGYHDDRTVAQIAPTAIFFQPITVRWENPQLTDAWRSTLVFRNPTTGALQSGPGSEAYIQLSRRNVEGGGRQNDLHHISSREIVGVKGELGRTWNYDVFFQTSRVNYSEAFFHDWSFSRIARALDVVADPVSGAPVCSSVVNGADRNCVPFNVWVLNGVTPAARAYVEVSAFQRALTSQQVSGGTLTANLGDYGIRVPKTRDGVEVAFGFERRTEKLDFEADQEFVDLAGQGSPIRSVNGGFTVKDLFGELRVPLFDVASLTGSYRRSAYDNGFDTDTFGVGFNTAATKYARLRGSFQRAVRAPNLNELFSPQFPSGYSIPGGDPCAGEAPARSLSDCARTGVRPFQYGQIVESDSQDSFLATAGGNKALKAETAKTYTLGLVLSPLRDLSATIDYFDIRIENTIAAIDGGVIFDQCLNTGDPFFCSLITRDPVSGALWYGAANVVAINQNIGKTRVAGTDAAFNYRWRLPKAHAISFDGLGTYLRTQSIEAFPGAPSSECSGLYFSACGQVPLPKWRHRLRVTWQPPWNFELAATWRYVGSTKADPAAIDGLRIPPASVTQPAMSYLDLAGSWNITKQVTLRGGVQNLADRDPPLIAANGGGGPINGNAFAQIYDVLGRHVFVSVTAKF